jgi:hypothetical protein
LRCSRRGLGPYAIAVVGRAPILSILHYAALLEDVGLFNTVIATGYAREMHDPES